MSPEQDDPDVHDLLTIDALVGDAFGGDDEVPERDGIGPDRKSDLIELEATQVAGLDQLRHAVADTIAREWKRRLLLVAATRVSRPAATAARTRGALLTRLATLREQYPSVVAQHPAATEESDVSISELIEDVEAVTGDGER